MFDPVWTKLSGLYAHLSTSLFNWSGEDKQTNKQTNRHKIKSKIIYWYIKSWNEMLLSQGYQYMHDTS
jgi:hypothetical protein